MHRSKKRSSMSGKDSHGATWLSGWGHDKRLTRKLERRVRERNAQREIDTEYDESSVAIANDPHRCGVCGERDNPRCTYDC